MPSLPQANTVPVKNKIFDNELSEGEELPSCQGKSVSLPSAESGPQKQLDTQQLLDAMQILFLQLEGITEEWNEWMKSPPGTPPKQLTRMQVTLQAQAPAILCCPLNNHPKHTINRKNSSQQPSMVGFFRVLSSLSVLRPSHREGMLCTLSGNLIPIARPPCKHPVDSFNFWWQVWTKYEMEIVPFSHKRNHKRRRAVHRSPRLTAHRQSTHGNCRSGSPPQARKTATSINESCVTSERPTSELTCAKLVGGTTPRPIAHVLPEIKSPFNLQTWHECLRTHPDTDFVIDLLHDIEVGVHIGYQPTTRPFQTCNNHLFARTNRWRHICFFG